MKRRNISRLIGGVALWPVVAHAQPKAGPVIGYLGAETPELFATRLKAFRDGVSAAGFHEGQNVGFEYRWAMGRNDQLAGLAADLVRKNVTVIAAPGSLAAALAARDSTKTIPVVFETGADPVAAGLVANLSRPGSNITGVTSLNAEVGPKRLDVLLELIPAARSVALLVNPTNPRNAEASTRDVQGAAAKRGLQLEVLNASADSDFDAVFSNLRDRKIGGLVVANETAFSVRARQLGALAARYAVPAVHQSREFAVGGGLMSYGGSVAESHRQAGLYAGRIVKGEKPTDLPVQQVTKVEFVVNMSAARAFGLVVPPSTLARADEVIE